MDIDLNALRSIFTSCSGAGTAEIVHACFCEGLGQKSELLGACENVGFKQNHLKEVAKFLGSTHHIFEDFAELHCGKAACCAHVSDVLPPQPSKCVVPSDSFLAVVGYSCKDMSPLKKQDPGAASNVLRQAAGTSGATCLHLLRWLQTALPPVVILENVEEMGKERHESKNVAYLYEEVESLGYGITKT